MVRTAWKAIAFSLAVAVAGRVPAAETRPSEALQQRSLRPIPAELRPVDARQLQGNWSLVGAEQNGMQISSGNAQDLTLSVRDKLYTIVPSTSSSSSVIGEFKVAQGRWPKQINLTPIGGSDAGQTYRGIYEIQGDIQRICLAPPGQSRPTGFSPLPGSGQTLYVWQRGRLITSRPMVSVPPTLPFNNIDYTRIPPTPQPSYRGYPMPVP